MEGRREHARVNSEPWPTRQIHVEWGRAGLVQAVARGDGIVIVDVMSFSTLIALVTEHGAIVRALAPEAITELGGPAAVAARFDAHVAGATHDDPTARVTLSPASAERVQSGDRLVVHSPNGGTLTALAAPAPFTIIGCLRNATAVGRVVAAALRLGLVDRVTIVAAAEQWKSELDTYERPRFALEDWLGVGAIASACRAGDARVSSEAELAARSFEASRSDLHAMLAESVTGRELIQGGYATDVALAAASDVDPGVPWLRADGFVARLPFTLRPATGADRPLLFALKQATMRDYVLAAVGRWDEDVDRRYFGPDLAHIAIVAVDGRDVAMVESRTEPDALYLANVQVNPAWQSRGLGGAVVGLLAASAHARGLPLRLRVLKVNERAFRFYERLGFEVTGSLARHWTMTLAPPNQPGEPIPAGTESAP